MGRTGYISPELHGEVLGGQPGVPVRHKLVCNTHFGLTAEAKEIGPYLWDISEKGIASVEPIVGARRRALRSPYDTEFVLSAPE